MTELTTLVPGGCLARAPARAPARAHRWGVDDEDLEP